MADRQEVALMAHLMRRAGFGATHDELEHLVAQGYEATVEKLLNPESQPDIDEALLFRYLPMAEYITAAEHAQMNWLYRMVNSPRALQEKVALFWHHVFATGAGQGGDGEHDARPDRDVPHTRTRQLPRPAGTSRPRSGHDLLARQPGQPQARSERELGTRASGAVLARCGVLHREGRLRVRAGVHPAGRSRASRGASPIRRSRGGSTTGRRTTTRTKRRSWASTATSTARTSSTSSCDSPPARGSSCAICTASSWRTTPEVPKWPNERAKNPEAIDMLCEVFIKSDLEMKPVLRATVQLRLLQGCPVQEGEEPR